MRYLPLIVVLIYSCVPAPDQSIAFSSQKTAFTLDTLIQDIRVPWGMDWLPDGRMLISNRGIEENSLSIYNPENSEVSNICNVPKVYRKGDGGMLDVLVHPNYESNPYIYYCYSTMREDSSSTLRVERAMLKEDCLTNIQKIFEVYPYFPSNGHYGSRLLIEENYLFISMGERYEALDSAQTLSNHFGKIMRIHDDGRIPLDNPFLDDLEALPEIWSYGHRNPQGMAIHPISRELWINEHGPQGGDEINLVTKGKNYGWPIITYGEEYGGGVIGEGLTEKEGMEQPLYYYTPSIAPSGMMFYTGNQFPEWKGSLFIGSMAFRHINRLSLDGKEILSEERLLEDQKWRVRVIKQGPDDLIYFGVDGGMVLRARPVK